MSHRSLDRRAFCFRYGLRNRRGVRAVLRLHACTHLSKETSSDIGHGRPVRFAADHKTGVPRESPVVAHSTARPALAEACAAEPPRSLAEPAG
jgi:hypothetical protein